MIVCAIIQKMFFYPKTVDVQKLMVYNNNDVRILLNSIFKMFNIRFVVSFLLFYTYLSYFNSFHLCRTPLSCIFFAFLYHA